jgi:tetratricopeptide (TPR) repeat protein
MNTKSIRYGLIFLPLFCVVAVSVPAQTAKHSASSRRSAPSDVASRKQLAAYLAEFQSKPEDDTLRSKIVVLAKGLNPAPAIPQLARDNFSLATAQMNAALSADNFKAAAKRFEKAAVLAPWYADADYSAATASSKAGDYEGAKRNFAFYLAAVRPGTDTRNAEKLRLDLDRQLSEQQVNQALQQFSANPTDAGRLQIIKLVQAMKTPPEIPEQARGHYVRAVILMNMAEDNPDYQQRAIDEYKAALLTAPWWGDAYKKMATALTAMARYTEAIANLNFYLLTQPADARDTQDEIYRLMVFEQRAIDLQTKKQADDLQRKLREEQKQKENDVAAAGQFSVEGTWYDASTQRLYFVGDKSNPECDYVIKHDRERWTIRNNCSRSTRTIDKIEVGARQISFRISGEHDSKFPFSEIVITFTLSRDGQTLEGRGTPYDKSYFPIGDHPVRWMRRE